MTVGIPNPKLTLDFCAKSMVGCCVFVVYLMNCDSSTTLCYAVSYCCVRERYLLHRTYVSSPSLSPCERILPVLGFAHLLTLTFIYG